MMRHQRDLPIGLFDSGVGGLTVLKAIRQRLPHEDLLYLGDTARLPYGTKSPGTVSRYALQATQKLVERRIKALVIACNTATAAALPALQQAYSHIPVVGVVEPGASAACRATRNGHICVIATASTTKGGAYVRAIHERRPEAQVTGIAAQLLVNIAEEGWFDGPIVEGIIARYLEPILRRETGKPDCMVLACTHFPLLLDAFRRVLGDSLVLVDSAATTADAVAEDLASKKLLRDARSGEAMFLTTDDPARFAATGSLFLGTSISEADVELIDL